MKKNKNISELQLEISSPLKLQNQMLDLNKNLFDIEDKNKQKA